MIKVIRFIFTKIFWIQIVVFILLFLGFVYGVNTYLKYSVNHSKSIEVPDLTDYHYSEVSDYLKSLQLKSVISDSIYTDKVAAGIVVDQMPKPGHEVKENRKIYITVNATNPPKVAFPELVDLPIRQAISIIESMGLKLDSLQYEPNECVKCVVRVLIDTTEVQPGSLVTKGTVITMVLGQGLSDVFIEIPTLVNMKYNEVKSKLKTLGLNVGLVSYEDCLNQVDSSTAKVYRQIPSYDDNKNINLGKAIDLFFTCDSTKIPVLEVDSNLIIDSGVQ